MLFKFGSVSSLDRLTLSDVQQPLEVFIYQAGVTVVLIDQDTTNYLCVITIDQTGNQTTLLPYTRINKVGSYSFIVYDGVINSVTDSALRYLTSIDHVTFKVLPSSTYGGGHAGYFDSTMPADKESYCACLFHVMAKKSAVNPYAVCAKSTGTSVGRSHICSTAAQIQNIPIEEVKGWASYHNLTIPSSIMSNDAAVRKFVYDYIHNKG